MVVLSFYVLVFKSFVLLAPYVCFHMVRMASRLSEIRVKVMCCMPTINVSTADTLSHQDPLIQTARVAAHGKRAAPLFDKV